MFLVLCLEGVHGAGKSELCNAFEKAGFTVLDEGFLTMPDHALHPQSLLMETTWVCSWFSRLLEQAQARKEAGAPPTVVIADRSPFSAVLYAQRGGKLLEPIIRTHIEEVEAAGVHVVTCYVRVSEETLWKRVQARLEREPYRARYNEGDRKWLDTALEFYENFTWDITCENESCIDSLLHRTKHSVSAAFPEVSEVLGVTKSTPTSMTTPEASRSRPDRSPTIAPSPALSLGFPEDDDHKSSEDNDEDDETTSSRAVRISASPPRPTELHREATLTVLQPKSLEITH